MTPYSARQLGAFRIAFGLYLTVHFAELVPYASELFGREGMLGDPSLAPTYGLLPNLLVLLGSPPAVQAFLISMVGLSVLLASGWRRPWIALLLWYGWACLFSRNPLISNPSIPYVGWLLLALTLVPPGEAWAWGGSQSREAKPWRMPPLIPRSAWLLLGLGYTISGLHKLTASSWIDGTALSHVLSLPLARPTALREMLLDLPSAARVGLSWSVLLLEILALPLFCARSTRGWAWLALVGMHLGIMVLVDFADLSLGMLCIHAFTFDLRWLPKPWRLAAERT